MERRRISDVLHFRSDIAPFLVHLTRTSKVASAGDVLKAIISQGELLPGTDFLSDAKYGLHFSKLSPDLLPYFSAVCLTETPIAEIHCLLEIANRQINLEPFGLVFIKERLAERGVSPVFYMNNHPGDKKQVVRALCTLITSAPDAATRLLPLISNFGQMLTAPGAATQTGTVDWRWEWEWRYPSIYGPLAFTSEDIFMGVCPHERIEEFEAEFPEIKFIDPTKTIRWYAAKLVELRKRAGMEFSVV